MNLLVAHCAACGSVWLSPSSRDLIDRGRRCLRCDAPLLADEAERPAPLSRLGFMLDEADPAVFVKDRQGRYLLANRRWRERVGREEQEIVGHTSWEVLPEELASACEESDRRALADGECTEMEEQPGPGGARTRYLTWKFPLHDESGESYAVCGVSAEVREADTGGAGPASEEELFGAAFSLAPVPTALIGSDGRLQKVNRALCRLVGLSDEQLTGMTLRDLAAPEDQGATDELERIVLGHREFPRPLEQRYCNSGGGSVWAETLIVPFSEGNANGDAYIAQLYDVTQRRRAERELAARVIRDPLTGLSNRTLLHDRLEHSFARARRHRVGLAALFIDLDGFKALNDRVGHRAADEVLAEVARRLLRTLRGQDTAARLGGDEFVVICEDIPDRRAAARIAERLVAALSEPIDGEAGEVSVTASIGVAFNQNAEGTPEAMIHQADRAMYDVKRRGGAGYELSGD